MGKRHIVLMALAWLLLSLTPSMVMADSLKDDRVKVTVKMNIENPEYFWSYPFAGKQMNHICVSGMGKTYTIQAQSTGKTVEFEVPRAYLFRVYISFRSMDASLYEYSFEKRGIDDNSNSFTINLKAPEFQPPMIRVTSFDERK